MTRLASGSYVFSPRYKKQILDLSKHREPGYPSFVTLRLHSTEGKGEAIKATVWYVGKTRALDGRETARYHLLSQEEGKVLAAVMDEVQPILEAIAPKGESI